MASLAVFDFDRTIVDDDSDATIINRLREKQPPPEWETSRRDWTPYMNETPDTAACASSSNQNGGEVAVFEHAYSAGLHPDEILSCIGAMRPTPGMEDLIKKLHQEGWDILLATDANTVFVDHWLKTHGLLDCVTSVISNRGSFVRGRLMIEPCMRQVACAHCPDNLCKSLALAQWCAARRYDRVVYVGDGRNDFCPATNLPEHATVFPRKGYPLDGLLKAALASPAPPVRARVVPWDDGYRIQRELFPQEHDIPV